MPASTQELLVSSAGLLVLASFSVYAGSFGSLKTPRKEKKKDAHGASALDSDDDEEDDVERITVADAYLFPVFGSVTLFGFYLVIKFVSLEWLNWLLGWAFVLSGIASVWKCLVSATKSLLGDERWRSFDRWTILLKKGQRNYLNLTFRSPSFALIGPSLIPSALYVFLPGAKRSIFVINALALSFAHNALSTIKLDTFWTGLILLSGLFLYDIWWVFGTEVMVKVATSLDLPIKILWPRSFAFSAVQGHSMLGLGDIVVPGMFVATALRYDFSRSGHRDPRQNYSKPYFTAAMIAYVAGLATTMAVMITFRAAQPALLYLSPSCILSFLITAMSRGELKEAWLWVDEEMRREDSTVDDHSLSMNEPMSPSLDTPFNAEEPDPDPASRTALASGDELRQRHSILPATE